MKPKIEILSQGDELVTGQIAGTNAAWLSQQLAAMGCRVTRHVTVGDELADLTDILLEIARRADCCISTGGLGPTVDDLTAEAVAKAFNFSLVFDEIAFSQIVDFFAARNRPMPECNRKQAMLPDRSIRLENRTGTAPGFAVEVDGCLFFFLPGVPSEMKLMFHEHIKPCLGSRYQLQPDRLIVIKTIGIGESDLQERLSAIVIPPEIKLGFRAAIGEVETKLVCPGEYPLAEVEKLVYAVTGVIGDAVLGIEGLTEESVDLITVIDRLMQQHTQRLAVVETLSGGLLTLKLAHVSGLISSIYVQSLADLAWQLRLDVNSANFDKLVKSLADAVLDSTGADIVLLQLSKTEHGNEGDNGLSTTGIIVLVTRHEYLSENRKLSGGIERKQHQATVYALDFLRKYLQGKALSRKSISD